MTDLLSRPIRGVSPAPVTSPQPIVLTAAAAAVVAALGGIVVFVAVSVIGWFSTDVGSFSGAVRVGVLGWLFGNGGGLVIGGVAVSMLPLGSLILFGWVLHRAGRWTAGRLRPADLRDVALATAGFAVAYAGVALIAFVVARPGGGHAVGWRSLLAPLVLAAVAGSTGMLRESRLPASLIELVPEEARAVLVGSIAALASLVAASALLFTASVVVHFSDAVRLAEGLHAGVFGGIVLALVGIAFTPNAILCSGSYLAGPGFMVGTGTEVSPERVDLGRLPAHPLLAALPESAGAWWQTGLLAMPLLAGAVGGWVAVRRRPAILGLDRIALRGGLAGSVGGLAFGLCTALATGSIGPGRMQDVGPHVVTTLGVCAVSAAVGGLVAALAHRWLAGPPEQPRDDSLS